MSAFEFQYARFVLVEMHGEVARENGEKVPGSRVERNGGEYHGLAVRSSSVRQGQKAIKPRYSAIGEDGNASGIELQPHRGGMRHDYPGIELVDSD